MLEVFLVGIAFLSLLRVKYPAPTEGFHDRFFPGALWSNRTCSSQSQLRLTYFLLGCMGTLDLLWWREHLDDKNSATGVCTASSTSRRSVGVEIEQKAGLLGALTIDPQSHILCRKQAWRSEQSARLC